MGDLAYDTAIVVNRIIGRVRGMFGRPYWSFSSWAKIKVKKAVAFMSDFQQVLVQEARKAGADGVICGHIHHAVVEEIDDIRYINSGDWVESCTAVVEDHQGGFSIVRWTTPALLSLKSQPAETARAA